jgi:hypothetical protein
MPQLQAGMVGLGGRRHSGRTPIDTDRCGLTRSAPESEHEHDSRQ